MIPPAGFSGDVRSTLRRLEVQLWDGTIFENVLTEPSTCPRASLALPCTQAVWDGENSQSVRLTAVSLTGDSVSLDVPIKARNHCGIEVAYAPILVDADVRFGSLRYLSPCQ